MKAATLPVVKAPTSRELDFGYIGEVTGANYDGQSLVQFATAAGVTARADLSQIARVYRPQDQVLIADIVAPVTPVDVESGRYSAFGKEGFDIHVSDNLADDANVGSIDFAAEKVSFAIDPRGLKIFVSDRVAKQRGGERIMRMAAMLLKQALMRRQEVRVRNLADATSNTSTPGTDWDTSSVIHNDVEAAQQVMEAALGLRGTHIALGNHIWGEFFGNANYKGDWAAAAALSGDPRALVNFQSPNGLSGLRPWGMIPVAPNGFYTSTAPGLARTLTRIWGDDGFIFHIDSETETSTWGAQLSYLEPVIVSWRDEQRGMGGTWLKMFVQRKEVELTSEAVLKLVDLT